MLPVVEEAAAVIEPVRRASGDGVADEGGGADRDYTAHGGHGRGGSRGNAREEHGVAARRGGAPKGHRAGRRGHDKATVAAVAAADTRRLVPAQGDFGRAHSMLPLLFHGGSDR